MCIQRDQIAIMRPNNYRVEDCYKYSDFVFFIEKNVLSDYLVSKDIDHVVSFEKDTHEHTWLEPRRIHIGNVFFSSKIIYI